MRSLRSCVLVASDSLQLCRADACPAQHCEEVADGEREDQINAHFGKIGMYKPLADSSKFTYDKIKEFPELRIQLDHFEEKEKEVLAKKAHERQLAIEKKEADAKKKKEEEARAQEAREQELMSQLRAAQDATESEIAEVNSRLHMLRKQAADDFSEACLREAVALFEHLFVRIKKFEELEARVRKSAAACRGGCAPGNCRNRSV